MKQGFKAEPHGSAGGKVRLMDFTFNTQIVDISVALRALKLYRDKEYKEAIPALVQILDTEPTNWQARMMLGACYYKSEQFPTAYRTFRYIYEKCPHIDVRRKAFEAVQASQLRSQTHVEVPAEFGCYIDRKPRIASWLDNNYGI
jgi:hypothetical protein